ncbi:MAG: hypothetical protein L0I24_08760, partial [Pseudonocardia sp.]|nr:hypothetical protein [Pseudonocardia sp.]
CPAGTDPAAARVDALVGRAADAPQLGDPVAARLLDAAEAVGHPSWRTAVRIGWVRAELALYGGRAAQGVEPAERALERARAAGAQRHVVKSRLVLAVVRAVVRPNGASIAELDAVADAANERGLLPLAGPAHLAAADLLDRIVQHSVSKLSPSANDGPADRSNESVDGLPSGAARRRHAAAVTTSVLYQLTDPVGRGLTGEPVSVRARPSVM